MKIILTNEDTIASKYWMQKDKEILVKILLLQEEIINNYEKTMKQLREIIE